MVVRSTGTSVIESETRIAYEAGYRWRPSQRRSRLGSEEVAIRSAFSEANMPVRQHYTGLECQSQGVTSRAPLGVERQSTRQSTQRARYGERLRLGLLLLLVLGLGWTPARAEPERVLRLGVYAYRPPAVMQRRFQPLVDHLSERLPGIRVELTALPMDLIERAVQAHQVDLVLTNPRHYVILRTRSHLTGVIATLVKRGFDGSATEQLGGVIFTRADRSDLTTLQDLHGQRIAVPSLLHTGGYLIPLYEIEQAGLPRPKAAQFDIAGTHDAVVERVLSGASDVGFVRTEILEELAAKGRLSLADVKIINRQDLGDYPFGSSTRLYPEWPMVALPGIDARTVRLIMAALLELDPEGSVSRRAQIAGFAPPADYLPIEQAMRALRMPPFDRQPAYSLADLWVQYKLAILAAAAALFAILLLSALLWRRNHALVSTTRRLRTLTDTQHRLAEETAALMRVSASEQDAAIDALLRTAGELIGADRAYLFQLDADGEHFSNTHEWCATGITAELQSNQHVPLTLTSWWWDRLVADGRAVVPEVAALPEEAAAFRELLQDQQIRSLFGIALLKHASNEGFVGFDMVRRQRDWQTEDIVPFEAPVSALGHALMRWRTEAELSRHREELECLVAQRTADLQRSNDQLAHTQFAMDRAGIGIAWNDPDTGRFLYANDEVCRQLGYSSEEVLGLTVSTINPEFPPPTLQKVTVDLRRTGGSLRLETRHRRKDDSSYPVSITAYLHRSEDREWFIVFYEDITERKTAEAELILARDAAQSANRAKSAFLANMSHEIRTPLNAIIGTAHMIRRSGVTEQQGAWLETLDAASHHLLETINAILDLSKIDAGKLELEAIPLSLEAVVGNVASMITRQAQGKGLYLSTEVEAPPAPLIGDPTRLQQALLNYATNAVKFTDAGAVTLRAVVLEQTAETWLVRLEVVDTGVGIASETLVRLFTDFEQADSSTTRHFGGTGLGLAITRRLAKLMGGEAGAESTPGAGSTFWLTARLAVQAVPAEPMPSAYAEGDLRDRLAQEFTGLRLLLVEDDPVNQEVAEFLLEDAGLSTEIAADGASAVELATNHDYALILMDMQMPVMDGLEATRCIRALPRHARTPIVAMTANAFADDKASCLDVGMNDFIAKPVDPEALYATVLKWCDRST